MKNRKKIPVKERRKFPFRAFAGIFNIRSIIQQQDE